MLNLTGDDAATGVNILTDAAVDRKNDMIQYSCASETCDSDGEFYCHTPIIDAFLGARCPSAYLKMTNFSAAEFGLL